MNVTVFVTPPVLAVTIALWFVLTCAAFAVNPTLVDPALTVTLAGTVRLALLLERGTANPLPVATPVSETVHPVEAGVAKVVVVQLNVLSATGVGSVMVPEPPPAGIGVPDAVEATTPFRTTPIIVVDGFVAI